MNKLVALLLALTVVAAACGDSGGSSSGFSDCDDLAQGGLDLLQDILDEVSDMSMSEFIEAADTDGEPEFITKFEPDADKLDAAQVDLGCSDEELGDFVTGNLDSLTASGDVGELMLEALISDPDVFGFDS